MSGIAALITFVVSFLFAYPISAILGAAVGALISYNMVFETADHGKSVQFFFSVIGCMLLSRIEKRIAKVTYVRWLQYLIRTLVILSILGYFVYALNLPKPQ